MLTPRTVSANTKDCECQVKLMPGNAVSKENQCYIRLDSLKRD